MVPTATAAASARFGCSAAQRRWAAFSAAVSGHRVSKRESSPAPSARYMSHSDNGSSPRGRGTHAAAPAVAGPVRFIPALAGNTGERARMDRPAAVHPRAGGEHEPAKFAFSMDFGSSPRGRGTRVNFDRGEIIKRFIPARAGNTPAEGIGCNPPSVHPRAGGEHNVRSGSTTARTGSSPRGRGTPCLDRFVDPSDRFIPARAGNTGSLSARSFRPSVHPRAGGEHIMSIIATPLGPGSSPRGRGTRTSAPPLTARHRFIPARAGNTSPARN